MSRSTESPGDDGFTLIEVVVAIGLLGVLVAASLPMLLGGIEANEVARRVTQAKSLALSEVERMRNLPFHVDPASGPFVDVLDRYYRDLEPPDAAPTCTDGDLVVAPTSANVGYVAPGEARCAWEPEGAMYRQVRTAPKDPDLAGYVVVVATQFLSAQTPPQVVTPAAGYDSQQTGHDHPTTAQLGVTVSVLQAGRSSRPPVTTYTQISRTYSATTRLRATGRATALTASTFLPDSTAALVSAGLVNLDATVASTTSANAVVAGVSASTGTGVRGGSGILAVSAPPATTRTPVDGDTGSLDASGCALICWGGTRLGASVTASATNGLPNLGSPTAPLSAAVKEPSAEGQALRFSAGGSAAYLSDLDLTPPLLRMKTGTVDAGTGSDCSVQSSGAGVRLAGSGWLRTTDATASPDPMLVEVCTTARAATVTVLPTTFAPHGIIRVRMPRAAVRCRVSGPGHAATTSVDYAAYVERWTGPGTEDYAQVAELTEDTTTDVLAGVDLAGTQVGDHGPLDGWVESWSNLTADRIGRAAGDGEARLDVPAVFNLVTQPLRYAGTAAEPEHDVDGERVVDELSTMSVTVGSLSCLARDAR